MGNAGQCHGGNAVIVTGGDTLYRSQYPAGEQIERRACPAHQKKAAPVRQQFFYGERTIDQTQNAPGNDKHNGIGNIGLIGAVGKRQQRQPGEKAFLVPQCHQHCESGGKLCEKISVRRVHIGKCAGDNGKRDGQSADKKNTALFVQRKNLHHTDTGKAEVQQGKQAVNPLQVIVGADAAGNGQEAAPQVGFILAVVEVIDGIPCEQMVGQAVHVDDKSHAEGAAEGKAPGFFYFLPYGVKNGFGIHGKSPLDYMSGAEREQTKVQAGPENL